MVTPSPRLRAAVLPVLASLLLTACVSQSKYDELVVQNKQIQQQVVTLTAEREAAAAQVGRLAGAIKYTVNSDLLFAPGSWTMSAAGKDVIGKFASKLAPTQQNKLVVSGYTDNAPIGPALAQQGVTTNQILSQLRADSVVAFLVSQGVKPDMVVAKGFGETNPIASNATASGRAKNRRVELAVGGQ